MKRFLRPERFDVDPNSPSAAQEWQHWYRTFTNFIDAVPSQGDSEVSTSTKLKLLINYLSPAVYHLINDCDTYEAAIKVLETQYVKKINEIYARHVLATRKQQPGETIDQYFQILRSLSKSCSFKSVTAEIYRDEIIRDSFINGISSGVIRQRLLENISLSLSQALDQARSLEDAQIQSSVYESKITPIAPSLVGSVNTPSTNDSSNCQISVTETSGSKCYFCGYSKHLRNTCPARNAICNLCKKKGHYATVCRSSNKTFKLSAATDVSSCSSAVIASIASLVKSTIQVILNGRSTEALLDTGSSESFISLSLVRQRGIKLFPTFGTISMASTSLSTQIHAYCIVKLKVFEHYYESIKLSVLKDLCSDVIIGHDILKNHCSLEIKFGGTRPPIRVCSLASAKVPAAKLFENMSDDCVPIAIKSRRYTREDLAFIKEEVEKLLSEGIIEESRSPWRAQVLVTSSENHKKRMVVDYSQTVNKFTLLDAFPLPRIDDIIRQVAQYQVFSAIDMRSAYHQIPIVKTDRYLTAFEACGRLYQFKRIPFGVTNGVAAFQRVIDGIIRNEHLQDTFAYLDDVTICGKTQEQHDINLENFLNVVKKYNLTINEIKSKFSMKSINLLGCIISYQSIKPDPDRVRSLLDFPIPKDIASLRRVIGMFSHYSQWIPKFSEKIRYLTQADSFPLQGEALKAFEELKQDIASATLTSIDDSQILVVETDASDFAIGASLSQGGKPIAFFSRTLNSSERGHSSIEKEAYAIVESLRKWRHFLLGRYFQLITDQQSVAFMFHNQARNKVKNDKIQRWRLELSPFKYDIIYRSGRENQVADTLSRVCSIFSTNLQELHSKLCHPGITRMYHWVKSKNIAASLEDIRKMTSCCSVCAKVKPRFIKFQGELIKATSPFERLNMDFKGPLPTSSGRPYMLTIIDEFSRFPFVFPCSTMTATEIIKHLSQLFSVFGTPAYIHSDRGQSFVSQELKSYLHSHGVVTSRTTPYNPQGNGQAERYNSIIWKTVTLALNSQGLRPNQWELVLPDALHCIRSLLCTSTNSTPHERLFTYPRRSSNGLSLPSWLSKPGPVLLRRFNRTNKYEPLVEEVFLIEANPQYARVQFENGRESTVSLRHLAPAAEEASNDDSSTTVNSQDVSHRSDMLGPSSVHETVPSRESIEEDSSTEMLAETTGPLRASDQGESTRNNPTRRRKPPPYLDDYELF